MVDAEQRLLVATDCLSEGVNLQQLFDAVVHYDLSWNPTRHQQREGRVDRFGQPAKLVRSILLFSPDSAIDGAVLDVILRKAEAIRRATGVTVPLPEERGAVTDALMNAVVLRKGRARQLNLPGLASAAASIEMRWRDAQEGERRSRARFAQNAIRPEEVAPEWRRWRALLGGPDAVRRFVERAMSRLDAALEQAKADTARAHLAALASAISERLAARGLSGTVRLAFSEPAPAGAEMVGRSHPLPATLAEALLEGALDPASSPIEPLGRVGAWPTAGVKTLTTVLLLRLRHKLTVHGRRERLLLAEEAGALAFEAASPEPHLFGEAALGLVEHAAGGDLAPSARERLLAQARERVAVAFAPALAVHARARADELAEDHGRVRAALPGVSRVSVEPVLPVDVIGMYVLVPAAL